MCSSSSARADDTPRDARSFMRGERGKKQQDPTTATIEDESALDIGARRDDATTRRRFSESLRANLNQRFQP